MRYCRQLRTFIISSVLLDVLKNAICFHNIILIHPKLFLMPGLVWILQDPNTCGHHSETAMHCVVAVGSVECCKLLVEAEADLERMEPWNVDWRYLRWRRGMRAGP